ncbi:MAG: hypothetical protein KIT79_00580 [Deltaproteobacteria bacterium]|nr:hypothetical protein [Deltaproteobacteria bacterium]
MKTHSFFNQTLRGLAAGIMIAGLAACGSSGSGGSGTGNGFADSVLGSAMGAEAEGALLSLVDTSNFIMSDPSVDAADDYVATLGDCASSDGAVVTIEFPCEDYLPNITGGILEVTFTNGSVTFETIETLTTEDGVELEINSAANYMGGDLWEVISDTEVTFGDATSTTEGDYEVEVGDPCSTINGDVLITMDLPELDDLPVDPIFTGEYTDYEVCNDGGCPNGTFSIGLEGVYEIELEFDASAGEATITISAGGTDTVVGPVALECTTRD